MTTIDPTDRRARFEALVEAVYEPLQRYARRRCDPQLAEDVVADALLVLWRRLDDVPADAALPWCYRVAANCLANQRRSAQRSLRLAARVAELDPPAATEDPEPVPDPALHAALAGLAPADQEVLRLWAWEALAPGEIALALDVSANAASIRLHRAKRRLGAALERSARDADTTPTRTRRR
jgi:RNA polymerase sigma-70 factor (ECF subfamily)